MDGRRFYYPAQQFQAYYVDSPLQQQFPSYLMPQVVNWELAGARLKPLYRRRRPN